MYEDIKNDGRRKFSGNIFYTYFIRKCGMSNNITTLNSTPNV